MPYYSNYGQDDKENQGGAAGQGQTTADGTFQRGGNGGNQDNEAPSGAGTIADSPGAAQGTAQKNAANTGSQYQSLDKYLGANADSNFGNQVTGKVGEAQGKGAEDQAGATTDFNNQVGGANNIPTPFAIKWAVDHAGESTGPTYSDQPVPTVSTHFGDTQGTDTKGPNQQNPSIDPKTYQGWMNATYGGPKSLSDSPSISGKYWDSTKKAITETGQIAGNDAGQYSLLNSYFGGPAGSSSYSSNNGPTGEQGLDLALAQNTAGYGQNVAALQQGAANLQQKGNAGAAQLQNNASAQAGKVADSANAARAAVGVDAQGQIIQGAGAGAIGNLEGTINQGVTDANNQNAANLKTLQNGGQLTPAQLAQYGLDPNEQTYGDLSLNQYLSSAPAQTAANTMTPDQLAQLKALQGLAGVVPDTLGSTTLAAPGSSTIFDNSALQGAISNNKTNYEHDWNTPTVQKPGENATSMAQLQKFVDQTRTAQKNIGHDPANPNTWTGTLSDQARDYINRINQFNSMHPGFNQTVGGSKMSNRAPSMN